MSSKENYREAQILELALKQRGFEVVFFMPQYQNYVKMLQYLPDIVLVEFPEKSAEHVRFVNLIRNHKQTKRIPVIGYGNPVDSSVIRGYFQTGINDYLLRPLKFASLLNSIDASLKKANKSLDTLVKPPQELDRNADIEKLFNKDTLPTEKIEIMSAHTQQFMAFPFTVAKVLKLTQDEKSGAADLAKVIGTDPVITANILKVSNSVFFASLNRRIGSVKDAIVRIGLNETKRIVLGMAVMDLFDKENRHCGLDRQDFWYHSLGCALIAERLARRLEGVSSEEAFLAGLLHDFGIIILDEFFDEIFTKALEKTTDCGGLFIDIQTSMLGINHNDVVKDLFAKWKLPDAITEAVIAQYDFHTFEKSLDSAAKKLALCVGVANIAAKSVCLGKECDQYIRPVGNWILNLFKMPRGFDQNFFEGIYRDIKLYRKFLELEEHEVQEQSDGVDKPEEKKIAYVNLSGETFSPAVTYLQKQGIEISPVAQTDELSEFSGRFDIVLTTASSKTTLDTIDRFGGMVKRGSKNEGDAAAECAPQMVLVEKELEGTDGKKLENVSFMPKSFDLRKLDQNIIEILMGKTIAYKSYVFKDEKPKAEAENQPET